MSEPRLELAPMMWKRGEVYVLDARALPREERWLACATADDVVTAIAGGHVTGAIAAGCAAAYGAALAAKRAAAEAGATVRSLQQAVDAAADRLGAAAGAPVPAPVFWALSELRNAVRLAAATGDPHMVADAALARAEAVQREDAARNRRIGDAGAALLPDGATVLTVGYHGALTCGGWGTALGIVRAAAAAGARLRVLACEGRPSLHGARLAAWELDRAGLDVAVLPDAAAPALVLRGEVGVVLLGADRVAETGDVLADVGACGAALAAAAAGIPVVVAAARVEPRLPDDAGAQPPEVTTAAWPALPTRAARRWPAAERVPAGLVTAIVTDGGVHRSPWTSLRDGR